MKKIVKCTQIDFRGTETNLGTIVALEPVIQVVHERSPFVAWRAKIRELDVKETEGNLVLLRMTIEIPFNPRNVKWKMLRANLKSMLDRVCLVVH